MSKEEENGNLEQQPLPQPEMTNFLEGDITDLLPLDIWIEIMRELPTSSVMGCKCVCKSWRLLIEGCKFVATLEDLKDKIFEALTLVTEFKELDRFVINYRFCPLAFMETWELCMDQIYLDLWKPQNFKPKQLEIVPRDGWFEFVMYKTNRIENLKKKIEIHQMLIRKIKELQIFMDECAKDLEIDTFKNQEIDRLKTELRFAISDAWINLTPIHDISDAWINLTPIH